MPPTRRQRHTRRDTPSRPPRTQTTTVQKPGSARTSSNKRPADSSSGDEVARSDQLPGRKHRCLSASSPGNPGPVTGSTTANPTPLVAVARPSRKASRPGKWSCFNRLPLELLEQIYFFSQNLELPRSNRFLYYMLNTRQTRVRMIEAAFHDTWDRCFGLLIKEDSPPIKLRARSLNLPTSHDYHTPEEEETPHSDDEYSLYSDVEDFGDEGVARFQSQVLEKPWARMDLILDAQGYFVTHFARGRPYSHCHLHDLDGPQLDQDPDNPHYSGGPDHFKPRSCFQYEFEFVKEDPSILTRVRHRHQHVHPDVRIPPSLLRGPWDQEMRERLFWILNGGAAPGYLDWEEQQASFKPWGANEFEPDLLVGHLLTYKVYRFADWPSAPLIELFCNLISWRFQRINRASVARLVDTLFASVSWHVSERIRRDPSIAFSLTQA